MPHKMVHVVFLHNHYIKFMVVVNPCGYSICSQYHVTRQTVAVNHQDAVP